MGYDPVVGRFLERDPIGSGPFDVVQFATSTVVREAEARASSRIAALFGDIRAEDWFLWNLADGNNTYLAYDSNPLVVTDPSGLQPKDKRFGYPDRFWDWNHRQNPKKGAPDLSKPEADEAYQDWLDAGKPDGEGTRSKPNCDGSEGSRRVVQTGLVIVMAWSLWEVGKWGIAILAAPETGGASLAGAAALP